MATKKKDDLYRLLVNLTEFDPETARPGDWLNYRAGLDTLARFGNAAMKTHIFNVGNPQRIGDLEFLRPKSDDPSGPAAARAPVRRRTATSRRCRSPRASPPSGASLRRGRDCWSPAARATSPS